MSRKVYIGRLNDQVRERDVDSFFRGFHVRDIMLKNGYGFVEFDDARDADDAVYELNGKELLGDRIIVEHARGPSRRGGGGGGGYGYGGGGPSFKPVWLDKYGPPVRTPHRVVVENLSSRVSWQDLKDYLRQAGEVTYADAHKEQRNQGIVEFATRGDMKNAISKLDDTEINGRRIRLIEQKPRGRRSSRSRSRSPSRSRRRSDRSRSRSSRRTRSRSRASSHAEKSASRSPSKSRSPERRSRSPEEAEQRPDENHRRRSASEERYSEASGS